MEIKLEDLYVVMYERGFYEDYYAFEKVIIGEDNAEAQFKKLTSDCPHDYAHAALYKAKVCNNTIEADHDNVICEKEYDEDKSAWVDCVDEEICVDED